MSSVGAQTPQRQRISKKSIQIILAVVFVLLILCIALSVWQIVTQINQNSRTEVVAIVETKRAKYTTIIPQTRLAALPSSMLKAAKRVSISNSPVVDIITSFISDEEADQILELAKGRYLPSTTMANDVNSTGKDRTSWSAFLTSKSDSESDVLKAVKRRASELAQVPLDYIEPLQIVKYQKGEYYRQHYDYLDENTNEVKQFGQRTITILVYLNSLTKEDGGCTRFHVLDHAATPVKGSALFWHNVTPSGNLDARTLHSGEPILNDECTKYCINVWIREKSQSGRNLGV